MEPDPLHLAKTIEARLAGDLELARTVVDHPGTTIEPSRIPSSGAMAALDALRALGATLGGKIDVHHTIGEGGMGVVHLATQATLGRHVAVKTLRKGAGDEEAALRILREAWVTGALEHPNVVPVHDVGVDASGAPVIVMKRIEGRVWSHLMRDGAEITRRFGATDPLEWNLRTLVSVCNAVHFAHSRGILHRDLKPDNVMIGEFGEVYVLDWGIAVSLKDDPSGRLPCASQATDIAGTPHYMAPEMLLGDPQRTPRAPTSTSSAPSSTRSSPASRRTRGATSTPSSPTSSSPRRPSPPASPPRPGASACGRSSESPRLASRARSSFASPSTSICGIAGHASWRTTRSRV